MYVYVLLCLLLNCVYISGAALSNFSRDGLRRGLARHGRHARHLPELGDRCLSDMWTYMHIYIYIYMYIYIERERYRERERETWRKRE